MTPEFNEKVAIWQRAHEFEQQCTGGKDFLVLPIGNSDIFAEFEDGAYTIRINTGDVKEFILDDNGLDLLDRLRSFCDLLIGR